MTVYEQIDLIKYFSQGKGHGQVLIIKGKPGMAKTTTLTFITRLLLEYTNFVVVGNVRFENEVYLKYPLRCFYISKFSQYLDFNSKVPENQPILLIVDDSQGEESFKSTGVLSDGGKMLSSFMVYVRKLYSSMIYIAHQKYIPESIASFEPYFLYKCNKDDFAISQEFFLKDSDSYNHPDSIICKLPDYNQFDKYYLPFLSHAFTSFEFDINWQELKNRLSNYEVGENLKETIAEYLRDFKYQESTEYQEYEILKSIPLTKLYLAICLKKKCIVPPSTKISEIINSTLTKRAEKIILENELFDKI